MYIKNLCIILVSLISLSTTVTLVCSQSYSLGVKTGDTFVFSYNQEWQSNQTDVKSPLLMVSPYPLQYIATAIMSVEGASVTTNTSYCYSNGIYMEVATSEYGGGYFPFYDGGYVPFFIPKNLGAGGQVPNTNLESSPMATCYINETINETFGSQTRKTNHLQIEFPVETFDHVSCNAYWDQATGVLTQVTYSYSNQTEIANTYWSINVRLIETSLFAVSNSVSPSPSPSIPEFSHWTVIILVISGTIVIIVSLKKKVNLS